MLRVSVVIPIHDGAARLPALLRALASQTAPPASFEVVFVDDASGDDSVDIIRAAGRDVVQAPARGGSYAARNLGLAHARADVIAFTDSDCIPAPDWIERGLEAMEAGASELVAGRVQVDVGERPTIAALVDAWRFLDQSRWVRQNFAATANLWVRTEVFRTVGPFKPVISGGDAEFGKRATAAGARLVYDDTVIVSHPPRERARDLARKGFRTGVGKAQHLRHADGALRAGGRIWVRPNRYLPRDRVTGVERLTSQGHDLTRRERLGMFWMHYFALKLPHTFGNLVGDAAGAWESLRAGGGGR